MNKNNFLVEIFTEELPPKSLKNFSEKFLEEIKARLMKAELKFSTAKNFATPRRLAVLVHELESQQPDKIIERKGPALDKAYDENGNPTQACLGFMKSANIQLSDLIKLPDNFVGCKQHIKGKTVVEIMPQVVAESLAALPIPKPMRWGNHPEKFIRPVHSILMMYGEKIIAAEILGKKSGNKTRGHRFLAPEWIEITSPSTYEEQLEKAFVIADFNKREEKIYQDACAAVKKQFTQPARFEKDNALLDEVTSLVEWPKVFIGSFDKKFLSVPPEALTSAMKEHQRYFPIFSESNKLLPYFVAVSNTSAGENVIKGNENVLRARLSDAEFFFETDKKTKLDDEKRIDKLKHIVFYNKLGTLFDKTERLKKLTIFIANKMGVDMHAAERAAYLAKADLTTELVGEFPELQGIAGGYYADREKPEIAKAIREQYFPRYSGDQLPSSPLGTALSIADRIDTLVGIFGINQAPTGDKDPFGLRRASLGVLRMLIENQLNFDLRELIIFSAKTFQSLENKNVVDDTLHFVLERLKSYSKFPTNILASVMALNLTDPYDIDERCEAVFTFYGTPEAESLSAANKRVKNILTKDAANISATEIQENLFESDVEHQLFKQLEQQEQSISDSRSYADTLENLASLRTPVDNFFDKVLVMTEDKEIRENRLLLLKKLRELFLHVADIALLQ